MAETLTESFCERCGTRYTFESAVPRTARLKGVKVLSRGLRNFVMSDDTSMDEAMAAARSDLDRDATTQQLDAFHKTFNFCMTCRQYTCGTCWNEADGRCLTCAPHLGHEILPAPFPDLDPGAGIIGADIANGNGHTHVEGPGPMAWPSTDLMDDTIGVADPTVEPSEPLPEIDATARLAALGAVAASPDPTPEVELVAEAIDVAAVDAAAAEVESGPGVDAVETVVDPAAASRASDGARQTHDLLHRFRPGQSLDDEIDAYERQQAAAQAEADAIAAAAAAAAIVEPTPAEAEPAVEPAAGPGVDVVSQPTWQIIAPESPTVEPPTASPATDTPTPVVPAAGADPQWPTQPEWPSQQPRAGSPFGGRSAQPSAALDSLWAESAREVASLPLAVPVEQGRPTSGVASCVSCGLSLSATARFCRRCGTRQG